MTVYALRAGNTSAVKIGFTHGPLDERIAALQISNAEPLRLLRTWPGGLRHERIAHALLESRRLSGEWFSIPVAREPFMLDAISALLAGVPVERTFHENLAEAHGLIETGRAVTCSSCSVDVEAPDAVFCLFCESLHCPTCAGVLCPRRSHVPTRRRARASGTTGEHVPHRMGQGTDLP